MLKIKGILSYILSILLIISVLHNVYQYQELHRCKDFIRIVRPWIPYESYPEIKAEIKKLKNNG